MIIPVIFSLTPMEDNLMYTWVFHKGVDLAKRHGWPVFAQSQYYYEKEKQKEKGCWSERWSQLFEYSLYSEEDEEKFVQVVFPEEIVQKYISKFPSQTDAFLESLEQPWDEMTDFMVDTVKKLEIQLGEKAEAFICLADTRFVRDAAKVLGISVIHYEWGPFRDPSYRKSAYLDLTGSICDGEMVQRYSDFRKISSELPVLSKREILSFFLKDELLHYAYMPDCETTYEIGLGLGYNVPHIFTPKNQITAVELYTEAKKYFANEDICVRYHPGDPVHSRLYGCKQDRGTLIEFIRKCKRIMCISSNLSFEAMLFNRPVYEVGESQYKLFANSKLNGLPDIIADDEFLSFIAFGYLVPFEFVHDEGYLRWRLSKPSEKEIYLKHLKYYCDCLNTPFSVFEKKGAERLKNILARRGHDVSLQQIELLEASKVEVLDAEKKLMKEKDLPYEQFIGNLEWEANKLRNELNAAHAQLSGMSEQLIDAERKVSLYVTAYEETINSRRWRYVSKFVKLVRVFVPVDSALEKVLKKLANLIRR